MKKNKITFTRIIFLLAGMVLGVIGCTNDDDTGNNNNIRITSQSLKMDLSPFTREDRV